jgi:hypothetical protein
MSLAGRAVDAVEVVAQRLRGDPQPAGDRQQLADMGGLVEGPGVGDRGARRW